MTPRTIAYWLSTLLLCVGLFGAGAAKLAGAEAVVANMARIGFPAHSLLIIGFWEAAAPFALLPPGLLRAKEWAYAGAFFAMTGAVAAHFLAGDPVTEAIPSIVLSTCTVASYLLRPDSRRLAA